jgi:hypothetical protein
MESQIRDLRYSVAFRVKELETRIALLENLVGWLTGLLIDVIAIVFGIAAAIFVAGDYYRLISFVGKSHHGVSISPANRRTELILSSGN